MVAFNSGKAPKTARFDRVDKLQVWPHTRPGVCLPWRNPIEVLVFLLTGRCLVQEAPLRAVGKQYPLYILHIKTEKAGV